MDAIFYIVHFLGSATAQAQCGPGGDQCDTGLPVVNANSGQLHTALAIIFGVIGALAVLMIVIAGLRFVLAQGNPQDTSKARSTIIYAAIGLIICLAAEGFVAFVLGRL